MAGTPPIAGFFIKFFVILSALKSKAVNLTLIILILNAICVSYYIRSVKWIYFSFYLPSKFDVYTPLNKISSIVLILGLYLLLFFFFESELLYLFSNRLSYSSV